MLCFTIISVSFLLLPYFFVCRAVFCFQAWEKRFTLRVYTFTLPCSSANFYLTIFYSEYFFLMSCFPYPLPADTKDIQLKVCDFRFKYTHLKSV